MASAKKVVRMSLLRLLSKARLLHFICADSNVLLCFTRVVVSARFCSQFIGTSVEVPHPSFSPNLARRRPYAKPVSSSSSFSLNIVMTTTLFEPTRHGCNNVVVTFTSVDNRVWDWKTGWQDRMLLVL